jgi:hypothetical protein
VQIQDYSLSNFGSDLLTPGTHDLELRDDGSRSSTGESVHLDDEKTTGTTNQVVWPPSWENKLGVAPIESR